MTHLPGLILLHGVGDDGSCWGPFVRSLDLPGLEVSTPTAPAHGGRRAEPGHSVAATDLVAEATAATEDLAARTGGPVVIGGHSMGAATALAVAAQRPDLAAGLFLEDPPMSGRMTDDSEPGAYEDLGQLHAWFTGMQSATWDQIMAGVRHDHPSWDPAEYEPWVRSKLSVDAAAFAQPQPFIRSGWAQRARAVTCPVVVAAGQPHLGGILDPASEADLSTLPGWTLVRLDTGHDVRRDAPTATRSLLVDLIDAAST